MFRTLIYPSSGACDCAVELLHRSFCSRFVVCWRFGVVWFWVVESEACNTDTTQTQPHQISNTQRTENKTTDVVIQQHSRNLLMMDTLMSETCWAHKKWNKIASDIKLVFYSSTITMMHGPINTRVSQCPTDGVNRQTGLTMYILSPIITLPLNFQWSFPTIRDYQSATTSKSGTQDFRHSFQ